MNELPIIQTALPPDVIDLGLGNPDLSLLPLESLRLSAQSYFATLDKRPLQYGFEQGDGYFRRALANFLTQTYGRTVDPASLFITSGASTALDLICTLYTRPGDVIFVEEPTYFLALRIFHDHGLRVVPVPMDDEGLLLESLGELLDRNQPIFLYTIPIFQNPSGRTLAQARREILIEAAQRRNFLIIADEVYHFLPYTQNPPQPFSLYSGNVEQVISINSFSKILTPGLRLGWIQAHDAVIKRLAGCGLLDSGGGMNPFTSALVQELVQSGELQRNIARLQEEYASRLEALDLALRQHLPEAEFMSPRGGFFFWVRLPGMDASVLRRKAQDYRVDLRQGELFSSRKNLRDYIRLSFSYYAPDKIEEGITRLRDCLENLWRS
jgi:DNA-binding transcriptional MocR family regulator